MGVRYDRCVRKLKKQKRVRNPFAVCTKTVGRMNAKTKKKPIKRDNWRLQFLELENIIPILK